MRAAACFLAILGFALFPLQAQGQKQRKAEKPKTEQRRPAEERPRAQESKEEPAEPFILARSQRSEKGRVIASGNVEIHYGQLVLFADSVDLNTETKDVRADGHVTLQTPNEVVSAESLTFNLDTRLGQMEKAVGMIQPTMLFEAGLLDRQQVDFYRLEHAQFTNCVQPNPRWKFTCAKANFKKEDYLEMWGSVFSIKGFPVFYWPYLRYPLKDRSTGFLMPNIGFTDTKGWKVSEDFYWAMARNMDATFNLVYYDRKGVGLGLEYRYLLAGGTGGQVRLSGFSFKRNELGVKPENAYIVRVNHSQSLPLGFSLVADIDYQSSYEYLREFDNNFNRAVVTNRRSQVYLAKSWSRFSFNARASRFETYFRERLDSTITQYLPQITFNSFKIKLVQPLYLSFNTNFSRWEYGWGEDYEADTQKRLQSLTFSPTLSLPFTSIPWLTVNSALSGNFYYYWQSLGKDATGKKTIIVDDPFFTRNFLLNLELRGPVLYRVFADSKGSPSVKHIFEPFVAYRYDSPTPESQRVVTAHGFFRYHSISYGLTNHLLVKQEKMPREMLTFGLSQTFYLSPEEGPLSRFKVDGKPPQFSEVSTYLRFLPAQKISLDATAGFNPYYRTLSSVRLSGRVGARDDPFFLSLSWFKSVAVWTEDAWWSRHQVNVFSSFKLPSLELEAQLEADYNILQREILYAAGSFVYHYQCLDLMAEVRFFNFREQPDVEYSISVGLGQIGRTSDFLGGMGF